MEQNGRRGSKAAQLVEVIVVTTAIGQGSAEDPMRVITEYWSKSGELLAVNDPQVSHFGQ